MMNNDQLAFIDLNLNPFFSNSTKEMEQNFKAITGKTQNSLDLTIQLAIDDQLKNMIPKTNNNQKRIFTNEEIEKVEQIYNNHDKIKVAKEILWIIFSYNNENPKVKLITDNENIKDLWNYYEKSQYKDYQKRYPNDTYEDHILNRIFGDGLHNDDFDDTQYPSDISNDTQPGYGETDLKGF